MKIKQEKIDAIIRWLMSMPWWIPVLERVISIARDEDDLWTYAIARIAKLEAEVKALNKVSQA